MNKDKWWELKNKYDDINREWLRLREQKLDGSEQGRKMLEEMGLILEEMDMISKEIA